MAAQRKKADVEEGDHKMIKKHSVALSSLNPDGLKALRVAGDYIRRIFVCNDKPEGSNYNPEEKTER